VTSMGAPLSPRHSPAVFTSAVDVLRDAISDVRPEVVVHEITAPTRLAPNAFALAGVVPRDGDDIAAGRLIMLVDPAGQPAWEGTARFVCYARAGVDGDIAADPLLSEVAWSWLTEALEVNAAAVRALGGTATTTISRRFGVLARDGDSFDIELRCSWSPDWAETARGGRLAWSPAETVSHLRAFADLLATMAGVPPRAAGVVPLSRLAGPAGELGF
jgi:hypothetical protein